ncbi:MAG: hypothetical protein U0031_22520 [Thermomicrobiales bacterium]
MQLVRLSVPLTTSDSAVWVQNTFATVDHPFHVARAGVLWNQVASGHLLRWVGQHQGGYPVEFYPLGEAWFEVAVRALSFGTLSAVGAHTVAVFLIFMLPVLGFLVLSGQDRLSPVVALLSIALHVSLPGGWYGGGYTELVQWGLVTNVFGAVVAFLALPFLLRFLADGSGLYGAAGAALAALAVYANPRSLIGVAAVGFGAWVSQVALDPSRNLIRTSRRLILVATIAAGLSAPELISLLRFGHLYSFVRYSGYDHPSDFVAQSAAALSPVVLVLGALGGLITIAGTIRSIRGTAKKRTSVVAPWSSALAVTVAVATYVATTAVVAFVPRISAFAPQLEPTRLMPLQRLLTVYLTALATWSLIERAVTRFYPDWRPKAEFTLGVASLALFFVLTRSTAGEPPDPASPAVPAASLYPVAMSAQPIQQDLESAVRLADQAAIPDTAILVIGSALSWHQPLWSPLWTTRPLYYDNWLWSWQKAHAGTPGYSFAAGNHYPDPAATLRRDYLDTHGIGAVVVTGNVKHEARDTLWLDKVRDGTYAVFLVTDPQTTITFGAGSAAHGRFDNGNVAVQTGHPSRTATARVYAFPRWNAVSNRQSASITQSRDAYQDMTFADPSRDLSLGYDVQPLDWLARFLALAAAVVAGLVIVFNGSGRGSARHWVARLPVPVSDRVS